ncbi:MAG: sugar phosphate isomerase/epimerase family protein [Bacillota bacterium]|nr:sugar phosphate isomerase/epimerase family protein [Bacillota bacterium]
MKLSATLTLCGPPDAPILLRGDLLNNIVLAAKFGFDGVELHLGRAAEVDGPAISEACRASGIAVSTIGTGGVFTRDGLQLIADEREMRERCIGRLQELIDLGKILQGNVIIGSVRGSIPDNGSRTLYEQRFLEGLKRLTEYAGERKVTLLIEAINRYETNFLNKADEVLALIDRTDYLNLLVHLDTFHMNIEEVSPAESISRCGSALGHIHFADSNRHYPGAGHYAFAETIKALQNNGYDRWIALECLPLPDAVTAAREGLSITRKMLGNGGPDSSQENNLR